MISQAIDPYSKAFKIVRCVMSVSSIEFEYRTDAATLPVPLLSGNAPEVVSS